MPRYPYNLLAALLTFVLGVFVSTLSRSILPGLTHLIIPLSATDRLRDQLKDSTCNEWKTSTSVSQGLGWDLAYTDLLRNSGVCPGDSYCEIAAMKPQPPVNKHFAEWKGDPIVSSILIELPDGHAAMASSWLVRTKEHAYFWKFHPEYPTSNTQPLPTEEYDRAFETMQCWQQQRPLSGKFFNGPGGDGYIGFLSLFKESRSRQMLLTYTDLLLDPATNDNYMDEAKWGRLWKTLKPINLALREQRKQAAQPSK